MSGPAYPKRAWPLEPTPDEMRAMLDDVADRVVRHVATLAEQPASYEEDGAAVAARFVEDLPSDGTALEELLDLVFDEATPPSFNTAGPGYLAYIPGGGVFPSALADLIANAINRYVGVWVASPALVQLELNVIRWFCRIVGYGEGSGGVLTTGGSLSNLTAIVTARRTLLGDDFGSGVVYTSDQTHHSVRKSAVLAGIAEARVREVPSDARRQMDIRALEHLIEEDRRTGLVPLMVAGSAGTTNTGAVDPLGELAEIAGREGAWFHVDAAYGGFFMLTERGRAAMRGLERADSITLDPHKGLFLPYGTGALVVRSESALRQAHATFADYMPVMQHDPDRVDFCDLSAELSRDFRGLRAWLPLRLFGIDAFRDALDEKLDLAREAAERIRAMPELELVTEPRLSLLTFRVAAARAAEEDEADRKTRALMDAVNARQNVYLTGTLVEGRFAIRICVLSFRTHADRMARCMDDLRAAVDEVVRG